MMTCSFQTHNKDPNYTYVVLGFVVGIIVGMNVVVVVVVRPLNNRIFSRDDSFPVVGFGGKGGMFGE